MHRAKRCRGWSDEELHAACGVDSVTHLSVAQASACIERLSGQPLPNPPGTPGTPPNMPKRRTQPGVVRMRTPDQVEQVNRLMLWYFDGDAGAAAAWLKKNFGVSDPEHIDTAFRAGQIARVLHEMLDRRSAKECHHDRD